MTFTVASDVPHSDELISCLYTSASVNRHSGCISALTVRAPTGGNTSLLAFGSSHAICLSVAVLAQRGSHDTTGQQLAVPMFRVLRVLYGHDAPVVALRWIPSPDPSYERSPHRFLVSLDTTGKLLLWGCRMKDVISTDSINRPRCSVLLELGLPSGCTPNAVDGCIVTCRIDPHADLVQLLLNVAADTALYSWYTKLSIGARGLSVLWTSDAVIIERKPAMCLCVRSVSWALMAQQSPSTLENISLHVVFVGLDSGNIEVWSEHIPRLPPSSTIEPRKFVHSATLFGHTDWVRCLDICTQLEGFTPVAFLVSGAQDHIIRLWRLYSPDGLCSLSKEDWSTLKVAELHLPERVKLKLCIASESVLSSHENWITGVSWEKSTSVSASFPPALLSSSMDRSLIVWMPPSQQLFTGAGDEPRLWLEEIRVGVVGGTGLGFLDCDWFSSDLTGRSFIGQSFQGSISLWSREENTSTWSPGLPLCGHSGPVTDLSWSRISSMTSDSIPSGIPPRVLLTAGADQTVRAHVPCRERVTPENPSSFSSNSKQFVWQEIARPQVHGYEMNAVSWLSSTSYVSAGDEKVARVFKATRNFFTSYEQFSGAQCIPSDRSLAVVAVQPTLGLSNQVASLDACENEMEEVCDNSLILVGIIPVLLLLIYFLFPSMITVQYFWKGVAASLRLPVRQ
ncbi:Elongator complex protein 2 [Fasciola gigantica]|uniref:Elongator complex protein 2 n=1 Tax=Fasciola gigantica TaxID=46835 RepID=A0A504XDR8_FASGI|nr:Elongator complex protein 2 [Fasciola gigantica]